MFTFLLIVQAIVTLALIGVILMQKSEGGGLGMGGSPSGFLSARGAADFLSRATAILAVAFVALSIALAVIASFNHRAAQVDVDAARSAAPAAPLAPGAIPAGPAPATAPPAPGALPGTALPGAQPVDPLGSAAAQRTAPATPPPAGEIPVER